MFPSPLLSYFLSARTHLHTHHDGTYLVIDVGVLRDAECPDDYFM